MDDKTFRARVDAFVQANKENILSDLAALVAQPSVQSDAAPGMPFGPQVAGALDTALAIAARMGLVTRNCEGYMGYAEVPGASERQIATIAHVDVVPAGNGWDSDPFAMVRREGYVLGRGVADDKGPAVLTLYIAKFFQELCEETGEPLPYTLRVLLGCAEETGMADVDYYLAHYPMPAFCFTPDAEFPVGYGEKGGLNGAFTSAPLSGNLVDFQGGVAANVVPDRAWAVVRADAAALPGAANIEVTAAGEGLARVTAFGKGGHASMPAGTVNAIGLVVDYLLEQGLCSEGENAFLRVLKTLLSSTDGSSAGIAARDEAFGPLTCIGGTIEMKESRLHQTIDVRYPTTQTPEAMQAACGALAAQGGGTFAVTAVHKPFYISPDSPAIRACVDTFNEVTGRDDKPFTMGGGTYARHFENAVSFGPELPGMEMPPWVGSMHGPNEGISVQLLLDSLTIYLLTVKRLMELEL